MKKILYTLVAVVMLTACNENRKATVTVTNATDLNRSDEMVEVSMDEVSALLRLPDNGQIVISDANGEEVAYQITYDGKIIFRANVEGGASAQYTIVAGTPADVAVVACGRHYPERVDDIAWENDLVAFRTYGPALQANGERAYGYDVWTKYNTTEPVVEARYAMELNESISYHVDHGNGLDCYKVGPTLGGGTAALMDNGQIVYPYCYKSYEILDNGPLRFTVQLQYNPLTIGADSNVIETRVISLDAGSYMNRAAISYSGLSKPTPLAAGLVLHEPDGTAVVAANAEEGYITYVDPTDNATAGNGKIFVGIAVPGKVNEAKAVYFDQKEKADRGGADGHLLAIGSYEPGFDYVYYFGSAWSKAAIKDAAAWDKYVSEYAQKVRNPLAVTLR